MYMWEMLTEAKMILENGVTGDCGLTNMGSGKSPGPLQEH